MQSTMSVAQWMAACSAAMAAISENVFVLYLWVAQKKSLSKFIIFTF
jgi:hypothetical protein